MEKDTTPGPHRDQRSVSYGELSELQGMFERQVKERGICFNDPEIRQQALFDFTQQYIEGENSPTVRTP